MCIKILNLITKIYIKIIKNTYRVLLTRGMKGCYIYCRDEALQNYLKERSNMISRNISYKDVEAEYKINA